MSCRWIGRSNLHEYCVCCTEGTRGGYLVSIRPSQRPAIPKVPQRYFRYGDHRNQLVDL